MDNKINIKKITTPLNSTEVSALRAGDRVLISGIIYTARDTAHKELLKLINAGKKLPFNPDGAVIFYAGPTPTKPNQIVGSIGPTTSYRMDSLTPPLLEAGVKATIGKGPRGQEVTMSLIKNHAVYFAVIGGIATLLAKCVKKNRLIAFKELGPEAILELEVENFPAIVAQDCHGGNIYEHDRPINTND